MPRKRIVIDRAYYARVPAKYLPILDNALLEAANIALEVLHKSLDRPYRGNPARPGEPPRKRTARLKSSYVIKKIGPGEVQIVAEGPGAEIAEIMERGGGPAIIRPRFKRALLIPVLLAEAKQIGRDAAKKRRGKGLKRVSFLKLAGVVKINGKYYLLRKWARRRAIRPRPHLRPAIERAQPRMARVIRNAGRRVARMEMQRLDKAVKNIAGPITPFTEAFDNTK
jgi:hypothetical protein